MEVRVTVHHIAQGDKHNHLRNPIALAAQEADEYAVCTSTCLHLVERVASLPLSARAWLERYNQDEIVSPFAFSV